MSWRGTSNAAVSIKYLAIVRSRIIVHVLVQILDAVQGVFQPARQNKTSKQSQRRSPGSIVRRACFHLIPSWVLRMHLFST